MDDLTASATSEDLLLAIEAIGSNARFGGLLNCTLAGIYAERNRSIHTQGTSGTLEGTGNVPVKEG